MSWLQAEEKEQKEEESEAAAEQKQVEIQDDSLAQPSHIDRSRVDKPGVQDVTMRKALSAANGQDTVLPEVGPAKVKETSMEEDPRHLKERPLATCQQKRVRQPQNRSSRQASGSATLSAWSGRSLRSSSPTAKGHQARKTGPYGSRMSWTPVKWMSKPGLIARISAR